MGGFLQYAQEVARPGNCPGREFWSPNAAIAASRLIQRCGRPYPVLSIACSIGMMEHAKNQRLQILKNCSRPGTGGHGRQEMVAVRRREICPPWSLSRASSRRSARLVSINELPGVQASGGPPRKFRPSLPHDNPGVARRLAGRFEEAEMMVDFVPP
jgi:hypothetical protein